jgi:hypothetical protein
MKLEQREQKLLNNVSRMEYIRYPWLSTYRRRRRKKKKNNKKKNRTIIKETAGRLQSWGRNMSFIGLTSWPGEDEVSACVKTEPAWNGYTFRSLWVPHWARCVWASTAEVVRTVTNVVGVIYPWRIVHRPDLCVKRPPS